MMAAPPQSSFLAFLDALNATVDHQLQEDDSSASIDLGALCHTVQRHVPRLLQHNDVLPWSSSSTVQLYLLHASAPTLWTLVAAVPPPHATDGGGVARYTKIETAVGEGDVGTVALSGEPLTRANHARGVAL